MEIFAVIVTLFVFGSTVGWVIEVFFRRFFSQKRWMNPGFLSGPYLPIYGFGVLAIYSLSELINLIDLSAFLPEWVLIILTIVFIGVIIILIEFIGGLIFIKGLGLKLWDYSDRKGNIMGIICPLFDVLWVLAGSIYYFFIHDWLREQIIWLSENPIYFLFQGIIMGMMIVDFAYSIHLATKVSSFIKENNAKISEAKKQLESEKISKHKLITISSVKEMKNILKNIDINHHKSDSK